MCSLHMRITGLVRQVMVASRHNITVLHVYCTTTYTALLQYMYSLRYYISADTVCGVCALYRALVSTEIGTTLELVTIKIHQI